MIRITGKIQGDVRRIVFEPTVARMHTADGEVVLATAVEATIKLIDGITQMSVELADNTQWLGKRWSWICYEHVPGRPPIMFIINSNPGVLRYADIRPVLGRRGR